MTTIDIDGLSEEEFRRSIESRLRQGLEVKAVEKLRALITPFAGPGKILPERFLTVDASDLALGGWDALGDSLKRHDRPGRPITALSIAFGWPGDELPVPDTEGRLSPPIEIGYYTDDAFPFSQSGREDLLEGYSYHGCTWTGDCEATDSALWLTGIDDLHGALAMLEARLLTSEEPDEEGIRAGSLGACLLSALLFQAVSARIAEQGLPRPLCVMSGSSGVYPYFDAPVAGFPEEARKAAEADEDEVVTDAGIPAPRYSSLLVTGIPRARKRAVLVLEETADEEASRISRLRGLSHGESIAEPVHPEPLPEVPVPDLGEAVIAEVPDSPLLAKKPSGQAWDFRELLSSYEPGAEPERDSGDEEPLELEQGWDETESFATEPEAGPGDEEPLELEQGWSETGSFEPEQDPSGSEAFEPEQDWGGAKLPEPELEPEPKPKPEPESESEWSWDKGPPRQPLGKPLPALSAAPVKPPVGPGFSLLETLRIERPQTTLPLPIPQLEGTPEPVAPVAAAPVTAVAPEVPVEPEPIEELDLAMPAAAEPEPIEAIEPTLPIAAEPAEPNWPPGQGWLEQTEARLLPPAPRLQSAAPHRADESPAVSKGFLTRLRDWWYGRR